MGTRAYKPPESFLGYKKYHYGFDIWGVGVLLGNILSRDSNIF